MDTNWKHQKKAITTDQKNRTDDENLLELDKRHLEATRKEDLAARPPRKSATKNSGEDVGFGRKSE
jgi:hypothetical protein